MYPTLYSYSVLLDQHIWIAFNPLYNNKYLTKRRKISGNTQSGDEQEFQAIQELNRENDWSISRLCRAAGVSRDGYYK